MSEQTREQMRAMLNKGIVPAHPSVPSTVKPISGAVQNAGGVKPICIGDINIPENLLNRSFMFCGMPGSGKSQAILQVLTTVRERGEPVIAIDHGGEFLQRFYRPETDLIFNPFDERSIGWSPFNEIRRIYDFDRVAKAMVPDITGDNQSWQQGAQQLMANILRALHKRGKQWRTNAALLYFVCQAPQRSASVAGMTDDSGAPIESLQDLLVGTTSSRLFEGSDDKTLNITTQIISKYMQPFTYLQEGKFSITEHVLAFGKGKTDKWLFLSYSDSNYEAIKSVFSILISCAASATFDLKEDSKRRFYFVLDEFASLDKIDQIVDFLAKARKYGGVALIGLQTLAQMEEKYGETGAQILMACLGNWLMLRVPDSKTATMLSDTIGDYEFWEKSYNTSDGESSTQGGQSSSSGKSWNEGTSEQKVIKKAVLPSEFRGLKDLTGYLSVAGADLGKGIKVGGGIHEECNVINVRIPLSNLPLVTERQMMRGDVYLIDEEDEDSDVFGAV